MSQPPLVSIVIPSYKPEFFEQTLKSALGQTYSNCQVIVIDNCPNEQIHDICKRYPTVMYQRGYFTRGRNITTAYYSGAGKYIKPLFDDDILHPFCIEYFVRALEARPDVAFIYSASAVIDKENGRIKNRKRFDGHRLMSQSQFLAQIFMQPTNPVGEMSTIMFPREVLWKAGVYLDSLGQHFIRGLGDIATHINLSFHGTVLYLDEELSYFRKDPEHLSNSHPDFNPDLGYGFSDYFELLIACDELGLIDFMDYTQLNVGYYNLVHYYSEYFPQITTSFQSLKHYVFQKYGVDVGFISKIKEENSISVDFQANKLLNAEASIASEAAVSAIDVFVNGNNLIAQNQLEKAQQLYEDWLEQYPTASNRHNIYHALGLLFVQKGHIEEAKKAFEQALQIMPTFYKSRFSLAEQLIKLNQIVDAQKMLHILRSPNSNLQNQNPAMYEAVTALLATI